MTPPLRELIDQALSTAMRQAEIPPEHKPILVYATNDRFGDYQANGILAAAKQLKKNPRELAQKVVDRLCAPPGIPEFIKQVEVAGPGFINIHINPTWLGQRLSAAKGDIYSLIPRPGNKRVVVVDYSGPNLAKEMHVGHLRSTIIGDSLVRVFTALGFTVIRQNHVGDWGTQFGMLIAHMTDLKSQGDTLKSELADLEAFYRDAKKRFDSDAPFSQRARQFVVKLQSGDSECLAHWREFIAVSLTHCFKVYQRLGVLLTEADLKPESSFNPALHGIVAELEAKGFITESDGAKCVFLEEFVGKDKQPLPIIVQKSDSGFLYATTDLAALKHRVNDLHATRILYVVDVRQGLHFEQIFTLARKARLVPPDCMLEHIAFGTMLGKDGKPFKTRTGDTVKLEALLDEAIERAAKIVTLKSPELSESDKEQIARTVGINAVKYADLSRNRKTNYIFDWDTLLALDGNTAPYLMYAYARIQSILRQSQLTELPHTLALATVEEIRLALKIIQLPEVLGDIAEDCMLNNLCQYLFELSGDFMSFYEKCPVLKAEPTTRNSRLALCQATANTLRVGFELLGLVVIERM